ncbi:MAG: T9SS type A sorting domain-containing protein [Chitinophagaceae bacterium]|nr:T9SS type A sorting domain-containing protein [Chitinophagaceae bacterium]
MKKFSLICLLLLSTVYSKNTCAQGINTTLVYCDTLQYFQDIMFNPDGSYYAVGNDTNNNYTALLAKFSATHSLLWVKKYGGSGVDIFRKIKRMNNGHLVMMGKTTSADGDVSYGYPMTVGDAWVVVTDSNGNFLRGNVWGYGDETISLDINLTSDDKIFLVGVTITHSGDFAINTGPAFEDQVFVALADSQLNKKWLKMFYSNVSAVPSNNQEMKSDTLILPISSNEMTGEYNFGTYLGGGSDQLFWFMDTLGNIHKKIRKGGTQYEGSHAISLTNDHIYAVIGAGSKDGDYFNANDIPANYTKYYYSLSKMDIQGNMKWKHLYGPFGANHSNNVTIQPPRMALTDDEIWVTHGVYGYDDMWTGSSLGEEDTWILQFDSVGLINRKARIGGTKMDDPYFIIADPQKRIFLGVITYNSSAGPNTFSCANNSQAGSYKLYELTKWPNSISDLKEEIGLLKISPNPAQNSIRAEWCETMPEKTGKFRVDIYNTEGKSVYSGKVSQCRVNIDVSRYMKGVYYLIVSTTEKKYTSSFFVN